MNYPPTFHSASYVPSIFTFTSRSPGWAPQAIALSISICIPAASQNTTRPVPYNSSYRAKEGERKKFCGSKLYCTVTLAAYPSNLCIREHLSKRAVSPVAISASSLGSIFNLWMKGWMIGERRSLISIAAGVSRIRYARV